MKAGPGVAALPIVLCGWALCGSVLGGSTLSGCGTAATVLDPTATGPDTIASLDDTTVAAKTGDTVPIHAVYPTGGPVKGPYPIVVLGHGFQIPPSQYDGYLTHLASFGYVALTADYADPFTGPVNNVGDGEDLSAGLDWAVASGTVGRLVDISRAGVMGHSRGGNAAVLAALQDSRFKAVYGVDPVFALPPGGVMCASSTDCPTTYLEISGLHVPTLFVGETLDSMGSFACAPAAGNFEVFYAHANGPSIEVDVEGASHMSFVDDPTACGAICAVCQTPTLAQSTVLDLATGYAVAFFERYLRGKTGYDAWLTGAEAQQRYVASGEATIASK